MSSPEKNIKEKLRRFIKKYYLNELLRGAIILTGMAALLVMIFSLLEWTLYTPGNVRLAFLGVFVAVSLWIFISKIVIPLLKLFNIRKGLSDEEAAAIVGKHFKEIDDRLVNLIQLSGLKEASKEDVSLLNESIKQKSQDLSQFSFKDAVTYKSNKSPFLRTVIVLVFLALLLLLFPTGFKSSVTRVVKFQEEFEKPQPYSFVLENDSLSTEVNSPYTIKATTEGDVIPDEVYLRFGEDLFLMIREGNQFRYTIPAVNKDTKFSLKSGKVISDEYLLRVFPLPVILEFEMVSTPPSYTQLRKDTVQNNGDLMVPEGTSIEWFFYTKDVDSLFLSMKDEVLSDGTGNSNVIDFRRPFYESKAYEVFSRNKYANSPDTLKYSIHVIKDSYPRIMIKQVKDSNSFFRMFFTGEVKDDYGITDLRFFIENADSVLFSGKVNHNSDTRQRFFYSYDFRKYYNVYDNLDYYFMVEDNDEVNGHKKTYSRKMKIDFPDENEIGKNVERQNENISKSFSKEMNKAEDFKKKVEKLREKFINQENNDWQGKKSLEELMKNFEEMLEKQKALKEELKQNRLYEEQLSETDKRLLEKQKELEEIIDEVVDEEMRKMIEELKKLMEELTEKNMKEALDKMEMSSEEMEQHLDRSLELFKQLKFEKGLDRAIRDTEELLEKQKALKEKSESSKRSELEKLAEDEKKLGKEIDSLSKSLKDLDAANQKLERPNNFNPPQDDAESAKEKANEAAQEMEERKQNKAIQKMQETEDKLESISLSLKAQQKQMMQQNLAEDIDNLKQILENLITLSFEQENLMGDFSAVQRNDPKYVEMIGEQFTMQEKLEVVEDSLIALSKRQAMIKTFITEELDKVKDNMERSIEFFNDRNLRSGLSRQQYAMMHINNLALMLSEALKNMQSSLNSMGSGKGQPKPGQGQPKMSEIRKMQQKLQQQLQEMKDGQKGKKPGQGKQGMSEKMARMAAKQAEIRRKLEQYRQELLKQGKGDQGLSKSLKKMEENETDLVNKRITQEMIERQQEIITRMLESEKAEREQEKEKRREGESANSFERSNPDIIKFKEMIEKGRDILNEIPPEMNPYYKKKVNEYFIEESR